MGEGGTWLNEPQLWSADGNGLNMTNDHQTDFWRETHYGFTHDNGHFFGVEVAGAFTATLRVRGNYQELYDQAGMMMRIDESHWVKFGVERWKDRTMFSSVVTHDRSDWSIGTEMRTQTFHVRATFGKRALKIDVSENGETWSLLRIAPFPEAQTYLVGPTACTPMRAGLEVRFDGFSVEPLRGRYA
jgi:regulation of enolase protein 1 (concanavalin A-like superfamily)